MLLLCTFGSAEDYCPIFKQDLVLFEVFLFCLKPASSSKGLWLSHGIKLDVAAINIIHLISLGLDVLNNALRFEQRIGDLLTETDAVLSDRLNLTLHLHLV